MVATSVAPLLLLNFSDLSSVVVAAVAGAPGLGTEVCRNCKYSHNGRSFSHLLPQLTFERLIFVSCLLNKRGLASVGNGPVLEVTQLCNDWKINANPIKKKLLVQFFGEPCASKVRAYYTALATYTNLSFFLYAY